MDRPCPVPVLRAKLLLDLASANLFRRCGVKILHGRVPDMAGLAKRVNRTSKWRITAPLNRVARQIWYGVDRTQ